MQLTASATGPTERTAPRDADSMAVASFVLGLLGLLVLNVFLGPVAITLAVVALWRGTKRPGRAWLGLVRGAADLVVLATVEQRNSPVPWSLCPLAGAPGAGSRRPPPRPPH